MLWYRVSARWQRGAVSEGVSSCPSLLCVETTGAHVRSVVPKELESDANPGKGTDVKLVDKRNEEYVAPAYVAFGGDGQTMGWVRRSEKGLLLMRLLGTILEHVPCRIDRVFFFVRLTAFCVAAAVVLADERRSSMRFGGVIVWGHAPSSGGLWLCWFLLALVPP